MKVHGMTRSESTRGLAMTFGFVFGAYALWNAALIVRSPREYFLYGIFALTAGTLAAMCFLSARTNDSTRARDALRTGFRWGLVLGGIGFLGGFILPLIFMPEANQGPLLGILITGPLGFVAGALLGVVFAIFRGRPDTVVHGQIDGSHTREMR